MITRGKRAMDYSSELVEVTDRLVVQRASDFPEGGLRGLTQECTCERLEELAACKERVGFKMVQGVGGFGRQLRQFPALSSAVCHLFDQSKALQQQEFDIATNRLLVSTGLASHVGDTHAIPSSAHHTEQHPLSNQLRFIVHF
jgi:hypothetical protein